MTEANPTRAPPSATPGLPIEGLESTQLSRSRRDYEWQVWGMKTRSRDQGRTAGVGFESGPLLLMIDEGGF